jgi:6-pyruvoyltetrahydropterin/6-carboxytetrahydropterin synthase
VNAGVVIQVRHNFETAHRLPFLEGKCESLHGHSWWAEFSLRARLNSGLHYGIDEAGISIEYGKVKGMIRAWIDANLDHGTMLGYEDPLVKLLQDVGDKTKLFIFGEHTPKELPWPTVEAVAAVLLDKVQKIMNGSYGYGKIQVAYVKVNETHVNSAICGEVT